jgi:hypothetical protein
MRIRICTAFAVAFLMLSGTARAQIFAGTITTTGTHKSVRDIGPDAGEVSCVASHTFKVEAEVTLDPSGSVLGRLTITESMAVITGECRDQTYPTYTSVVDASSLTALAATPVFHMWNVPAGPVYMSLSRLGDSLTGTLSGTFGAGYSTGGGPDYSVTLTGSLSGGAELNRKICYEVGAVQPLNGAGGTTYIATTASCDCSLANLPSWFTPLTGAVAGDMKRFDFIFGKNTGSVPRQSTATLTCGAERYPVIYSQPPGGGAKPKFPRTPSSVGSGVRGED